MHTKAHWEQCNASAAYHAANKFALQLAEYAKKNGYNRKTIKIRGKEEIIKGGFGKSDAQVIWEDGPQQWALEFPINNSDMVSRISEGDQTVSFYLI